MNTLKSVNHVVFACNDMNLSAYRLYSSQALQLPAMICTRAKYTATNEQLVMYVMHIISHRYSLTQHDGEMAHRKLSRIYVLTYTHSHSTQVRCENAMHVQSHQPQAICSHTRQKRTEQTDRQKMQRLLDAAGHFPKSIRAPSPQECKSSQCMTTNSTELIGVS